MNKKFKAAIIGCGDIAGGYDPPPPLEWSMTHAGGYLLCPDTELIAAADIDKKNLYEFGNKWGVKKLYQDYQEMLQKEEIDILSICVPTEHHHQVCKNAIHHGIKAIFMEKPLSYKLEEAKELAEISKGKTVAVNYFRRWNPTFDKLKQEIADGTNGKLVFIRVYYTKGVLHNASHGIDLLRYLVGEPRGGRCISEVPPDVEDYPADFYLQFGGDIQAYFLNIENAQYNIFEIDLLSEKGRILISQRGQQIVRFKIVQEPFYKTFDIIKEIPVEETEWRNCTTRAVTEIVDCFIRRGNTSCTMEDGLRDLEICLAVLDSGRNNSRLFEL
jgi:predicted dehydrogenase